MNNLLHMFFIITAKHRSDPMQPSHESGLTLIELLVVLLIVALGWFTLLPRLDPTAPASARDRPLAEVNELLARAGTEALNQGRFQELLLERQAGRLIWREESVRLPSGVAECRINNQPCPAREAVFRLYAHGGMDSLELVLFSGERWSSADLASHLVHQDLQGKY